MRTYMARLGAFSFGIDTAAFQELQRASTYRWEQKNRIGRKPAQQNVGQGADTITLQGVIYPHYRGGLGQIEAMRRQAASGEPLPLIYAFETVGQFCGQWCITSIEETRTVFFDNGTPRKIEFSLSLVEYGEDSGAASVAAVVGSVASAVNTAGAAQAAASAQSAAAAATTQAQALTTMQRVATAATTVANTVTGAVNAVVNNPAVRLAQTAVREVANAGRTVNAVINAAEQVKNASNPVAALSALSSLSSSAGAMSDAVGAATQRLGAAAGNFGGSSANTLYRQEIGSATTALGQLSGAAASVKVAANTLKGFF